MTVLAALESTMPSFCLSHQIGCQETTVTVLTVLAASAVVAVSVVTATLEKDATPYRSLRARKCTWECPRKCLQKSGCARMCLGKCFWGPSKSDLKVSKKCLFRHF